MSGNIFVILKVSLLKFLILLLFLYALPIDAQIVKPLEPVSMSIASDSVHTRIVQMKIPARRRSIRLTDPRLELLKTQLKLNYVDRFVFPAFWENSNIFGLSFSEVAFVNWNAGGDNAVTALGKLQFLRNYKHKKISWQNEMELRFGWNAQEGRKWRKTDDLIRLNTTFGYRRDTLSNWYYSAKGVFNTQFADGFKYPDRSSPISRFMAPGYLFLGAGVSYITADNSFNLYLSPLTHRSTFVLDEELANQGAFGVRKAVFDSQGNVLQEGERIFTSLGLQITNSWITPVIENVILDHRISLYTDYLRNFGNVDIDWELKFFFSVNKYLRTTLGAQIIYDDDIRFDVIQDQFGTIVDAGVPKVQFRQWLSIGIDYRF